MPIFAALFSAVSGAFGILIAKMFAARISIRAVGVAALIALTLGLVVAFNLAIAPFVQAVFSTQYGQFLGLLFPPIAGSVVAALMAFWLVVMTYRLQTRVVSLTASV